jgi:DNA-binding FadR family transcriptional regulator
VSPAHVLEPTYEAIKRRLLNAHWSMGTKLEAMKLADELGVSITPVRDSLNRLFGEHLVDFVHGEGFRVSVINEGQLRDLLGLNCILLMAAAESNGLESVVNLDSGKSNAERTAEIFLRLSSRTQNEVLVACVTSINDRLHIVRNIETELFADLETELSELANACKNGKTARALLMGLIPRYHNRRVGMTSQYVRLLSVK